MKEFHRNYVLRPTEQDKKGRRVKNQSKETCKCVAPFVKLHYYNCPAVKKSCPIHGNNRRHGAKEDKGDLEKNMIISFHPSSKTERLFQPVKTLLAQCNPETKVNLQYYSPKSTTSKESLKHQQVQTNPEDGKKAFSDNVFVEKTKTFVADKTNKMKKLKQCFHSPCNSIVHKSRSQTSIKEKFQEIFRDGKRKMNNLGTMAPDKPPGDLNYDSNLTWWSNKFDWEKLSAGKTDSDFITVTQQAKNNLINHKIFEIKHKKGLNEYPFGRLSEEPSRLVYSSLGVERPLQKKQDNPNPQEKKQFFGKSPPSEGSREKDRKQKREEELSSSENSQTSSSSSVYFTPFIFVPASANSENDSKSKSYTKEAIQVGSKEHGDGKREIFAQKTDTPSLQSEREIISYAEESKTVSVLMQTDPERQSGDSGIQEWYLRPLEVAESFTTRGTQTDESLFRLDKGVGDSRRLSELSSEIFALAPQEGAGSFCVQGTQTSTRPDDLEACGSSKTRTIKVQTDSRCRRERDFLGTTTYTMTTMDKVVQTESCKVLEVQRLWSFKVNKSQMGTPKISNKTTQATLDRSESSEEVSEFIDLDSSKVTFVVKPFNNQESDQAIDKLSKAWWGKSHSDSELAENRRCECFKPDYVIPLSKGCSCNRSETTRDQKTTPSQFSSSGKGSSNNAKVSRPESKADKSLGTEDGSQRFYKRADKALGTDSGADISPELCGKADKALGTDSGVMKMNKRADKALETDDETPSPEKKEKSPREAECSCKAEQTSQGHESPRTTLSDLSELTKIIQDFFEKTGKQALAAKTCPCGSSTEKKVERTVTTESKRTKNEYVDYAVGGHAGREKKDSEAMTDTPRKPRGELATAETQASSSTKRGPADRVKIRRSVLLDDNETKTRFICSLCAREISTYSMNAATNTENLQITSRKKEKTTTSVGTEVSELLKIKTVSTIKSFENPKRLTSAPEPGAGPQSNDPNVEDICQSMFRTGEFPLNSKNCTSSCNDRTPQVITRETIKRTATTTIPRPLVVKSCICESLDDVCSKDSFPNREGQSDAAGTSRGAPPKGDFQPSAANGQSRSRRSPERNRTQRRSLEPYYPVLIKSPWPRDFSWNSAEKSQNDLLQDSQSATSQQKRSCERETEAADIPVGKKMKSELESPSGQYFVFGNAAPQDLRMGDRIVFPNKAEFILIPSLSASSVTPTNKHSLSQSKIIKSEEKVRESNRREGSLHPEGLADLPDLSSTKSCRLTPIRLECDDKLFECRVCKSLTFMKTDKDGVVFHWRLACRPTVLQYPSPTARRTHKEDSESLHRDESSAQNLEEFLEESSHFSERSDSPSPYELLPEEPGETTEEDSESKRDSRRGSATLDDLFKANAAASSKSFNRFWFDGYTKKE